MTLMSPLGQTIAKIEITPQMTTFTAPNRAPASAPDAEELIKSQLGWTLPVSGMKGWLQGCATVPADNLLSPHLNRHKFSPEMGGDQLRELDRWTDDAASETD